MLIADFSIYIQTVRATVSAADSFVECSIDGDAELQREVVKPVINLSVLYRDDQISIRPANGW